MSLRDRLFVNSHQAGPDALNLAASLGVGGVRIDGIMGDLWPGPDRWTHGWLDSILSTCQTLNLQVYLSLSATPSWLGPNRGDLPPLEYWKMFCAEMARYYAGRVKFVGCWNEWPGDSQAYVNRLLRPMAEAFRAANAGYMICGPDLETERDWPTRLTDVIKYGADCLDIVTVHSYQSTAAEVWASLTERRSPRWRWLPSMVPWWTPSIRQVIEAAGWHGPTWVTETGWRSDRFGEAGQAERWEALLTLLSGAEWPAGMCVFNLIDEETPDRPPVTWGMFRAHGSIKPAGVVLQRHCGRAVV